MSKMSTYFQKKIEHFKKDLGTEIFIFPFDKIESFEEEYINSEQFYLLMKKILNINNLTII